MIKRPWLALILLLTGWMSQAEVLWPTIASPLAEFMCQLRIVRPTAIRAEERDKGLCSGTFVRPGVFVLASHCMDHGGEFAAGDLLPRAQDVQFYLSCPGGRTAKVTDSYMNPGYFAVSKRLNARGEIGDQHVGMFTGLADNDPAPDVAVLLTDPVAGAVALPTIPRDDRQLKRLVARNQCQVLGYSPHRCDIPHSAGCLRSANLKFLEGRLTILNDTDFGPGDSGSGVICSDKLGKRYLVGVYYASQGTVTNSSEYQDFLAPFLTAKDICREIRPLLYSSLSLVGREQLAALAQLTGFTVNCGPTTETCAPLATALVSMMKSEPRLLEYMRLHDWSQIAITTAADDTLLIGHDDVKVGMPFDGNLDIRIGATAQDVRDFLNSLLTQTQLNTNRLSVDRNPLTAESQAILTAKGYVLVNSIDAEPLDGTAALIVTELTQGGYRVVAGPYIYTSATLNGALSQIPHSP